MSLDNDFQKLDGAFAAGRSSGLADEDIGACPFTRKEATFREAWLNGYVIGQMEVGVRSDRP